MTDENYSGFHCGYCNSALLDKGWKPRKWCNTTCRRYFFKPPFSKYPKARDRSSLRTREEHSKYLAQIAYERWKSQCLHCGTTFSRKTGGNSTDGSNSYCSMQCRTVLRAKVRHERELYRSWSNQLKRNKAEKIKALLSILRKVKAAKQREELRQAKAQTPCVTCEKPVGYAFGRGKLYCGPICRPNQAIEIKRAYRKKRKALERGAKVGETVSPLKVFNQCGWKCQICGVLTPPKLRGKNKPTSPELDHIVPLSKGGSHSYENTQLLCRSCNGWKSDKVVVGQRLLFA